MSILIALLIFVGVYAVAKFLLSKVSGIAELAEILAILIGVVVAASYAGIIK